ncbi:MAG: transcription elongation factor GreA [Planctomycetaceae bacterium]|jgi:transcription elongation factor GreA|nr:transcription elongation factor GreA [Planctomycetaceae bacterium]
MDRQPISQGGYEKLREEIRVLDEERIPEVREKVAEARAEGDLRENAEYHGQREMLGMLEAKLNQLKTKLSQCEIVDKSKLPKDIITFGSRVTVKNLGDNGQEQYEFVGPGEEDYTGEVMKILTTSPLASGLMGKKVGDQVEIQAPIGLLKYEVLAFDDA